MDGGDPDAPTHKRPRLDSVNPVYNAHPPPHPPSHSLIPVRHPSHPTDHPQQPDNPPPRLHHQPSHTYPPSDTRHLPVPRSSISSPGHRPHGLPGTPVTLPARHVPQDTINTYRTPTPHSTAPPPDHPSRPATANIALDPQRTDPSATQGMEHGGPSPWPANTDPHASRHGSITNGYNSTMSPPNDAHFHTPPLPQTPHYGQPPTMAPGAYSNPQYMPSYAPNAMNNNVRRKQVRATQACNHCRSRKQKCDEARPCQFCRENHYDCQYKDVPPPKQDRSMMQLQDSINGISETLKSFVDNFTMWKQHVDGQLASNPPHAFDHASPQNFGVRNSASEQHTPRLPTPVQGGRTQFNRVNSSMKMESPIVSHSQMSPLPAQSSTPIKRESFQALSAQPATPADSVTTTHTQLPSDVAHPKQRTGLQADHRTPAHRLFVEWQSMEKFCDGVPFIENLRSEGKSIDQYPMHLEQDRGILRVWGVGEGNDLSGGAYGAASPGNYNHSDSPSPASTKEGLWGCPPADYPSPSVINGDFGRRDHVGGLGPDGKPDFRSSTLWQLLDSYLDNIHNLHPFLNPAKLRKKMTKFELDYSPDRRTSTMSPSAIPERLNGGIKRKRSSSGVADDLARISIKRSITNCVILFVLALGKVCSYKDKLPHPHSDKASSNNGAWDFHDSPRSTNMSFGSDTSDHRPRNIDILPGMAYYSYATDILGNHGGGNTIDHAQAHLLAALYLGQFGRVLESWSLTHTACRICLVLVRAEGKKLHRPAEIQSVSAATQESSWTTEERLRINLIKCVYWTCLQMESDIIAEISELQPSAITDYQNDIMYPSGVFESFEGTALPQEPSSQNMFIYSGQIHLRIILNDAHNSLYGARLGFDSNNIDDIGNSARSHAELLDTWRRFLPPSLKWDDSDPPSTDINIARVRAKYYGGYYVTLRPLLFKAIHYMKLPPTVLSDHNSSLPITGNAQRDIMDLSTEDAKALQIVQKCVESAIQSTIAFDRIGADENEPYLNYKSQRKTRLIVPNIFGTLHAQFGNILVLTAVYKSPMWRFLPKRDRLTKETLSALYQRTQDILDDLSGNSPILSLDYDILDNIARQHEIPYDRSNHKRPRSL